MLQQVQEMRMRIRLLRLGGVLGGDVVAGMSATAGVGNPRLTFI
jgi:hypothetical protein